jgi:hypothetical protein
MKLVLGYRGADADEREEKLLRQEEERLRHLQDLKDLAIARAMRNRINIRIHRAILIVLALAALFAIFGAIVGLAFLFKPLTPG